MTFSPTLNRISQLIKDTHKDHYPKKHSLTSPIKDPLTRKAHLPYKPQSP